MDFFEASQKRRSYRGNFLNEPVSRDDLRKIVQAGLEAPSGCNRQTTSFVVVVNPSVIKEIQAIPGGNKALREGKAYILCVVDKIKEAVYEGKSFQLEDCSAATENILLAITALNYGGVWIDGWLRSEGRAEKLAELVNLPHNKMVQIIIPLGRPADPFGHPEKKTFEEQVTFI